MRGTGKVAAVREDLASQSICPDLWQRRQVFGRDAWSNREGNASMRQGHRLNAHNKPQSRPAVHLDRASDGSATDRYTMLAR